MIYSNDIKIMPFSPPTQKSKTSVIRIKRVKNIQSFNNRSVSNLLHICRNSGHKIKSSFCLTYHNNYPSYGRILKKHLHSFLVMLHELHKFQYIWVLEFQERGAPHFHFFVDVSSKNKKFHEDFAKIWNSITKESELHYAFHMSSRNFFPWNMITGTYLSKVYMAKSNQKDVPENFKNVGRFWGCSRSMKPVAVIISSVDDKINIDKTIRPLIKAKERKLSAWKGRKIKLRQRVNAWTLKNGTKNLMRLFYGF
jgi:hypothetical protein